MANWPNSPQPSSALHTVDVGVSVAATTTGNRYDLAGVAAGTPTWVDVAGGSAPAPIATNQARQLTSSPDIGIQNGTNTTQFMLVAFDTTTSLVLLNYTIAASG